jgi:hypothetical protein
MLLALESLVMFWNSDILKSDMLVHPINTPATLVILLLEASKSDGTELILRLVHPLKRLLTSVRFA